MKRLVLRFREVDRDKFEAIQTGLKSIETRAATVKFRNLQAGDIIVASCGVDKIEKTIKKVQHFNSVEDMFMVLDMNRILPGVKTLVEAKKVYYSFPGYKEKIQEHGIIALALN